jgi:hypothetical protein
VESLLREHTHSLNKEREAATHLRAELAERPTNSEFIDLKKQLKVLHKVAFHLTDEDDNNEELGEEEESESKYGDADISYGTESVIYNTFFIRISKHSIE